MNFRANIFFACRLDSHNAKSFFYKGFEDLMLYTRTVVRIVALWKDI